MTKPPRYTVQLAELDLGFGDAPPTIVGYADTIDEAKTIALRDASARGANPRSYSVTSSRPLFPPGSRVEYPPFNPRRGLSAEPDPWAAEPDIIADIRSGVETLARDLRKR
jgi:hypothetical protein